MLQPPSRVFTGLLAFADGINHRPGPTEELLFIGHGDALLQYR